MLRRLLVSLLLVLSLPVTAAGDHALELVRTSTAEWLGLVDSGRYADSWAQSSSAFQGRVSNEEWVRALTAVRIPLGAVRERQELDARFAQTLPGAPDGQYVVLQFRSEFEKKSLATETVTVTLEENDLWKVVGYFIQ